MKINKYLLVLLTFVNISILTPRLFANPAIEISPSTFNFGWAPDNAVLSSLFTVKNVIGEMVPLLAVQPSCGCTATDFSPDGLGSAEETKIHITFNTRGYSNIAFNKVIQVKAGSPEQSYQVNVAGHVTNASAKVLPEGDGIASFDKDSGRKKEMVILNKSETSVELSIVQQPAPWAKIKISPQQPIPAGKSATLGISVDGPLDAEQQTSATFEAKSADASYRFTIAIRTGVTPEPYRKIRNAPKSAASPSPAPAKSDKK